MHVYTVTDGAISIKLLSSCGKALTCFLMTEHNLNKPIDNYKKIYTLSYFKLSGRERTKSASNICLTNAKICEKRPKFLR